MSNMYFSPPLLRTRGWLLGLLAVLLSVSGSWAQLANNYVPTSTGRAYATITGSDSVIGGMLTSTNWADDNLSARIAIPPFTMNGATYVSLFINTNGVAQLSIAGTNTPAIGGSTYGTQIINSAGRSPAFYVTGRDQGVSTLGGTSLGTPRASIRKFGTDSVIVQWQDNHRYISSGTAAERISYQMILVYAGSRIKYVYKTDLEPAVDFTPGIGIGQSTSDFVRLLVNTVNNVTWATPSLQNSASGTGRLISTAPARSLNGVSYTFAPTGSITCIAPTVGTTTLITGSTATLNISAAVSGNSYDYEVRSSGLPGSGATGLAASGSQTAAAATMAVPVTGLSPLTTYYVYFRNTCAGPVKSGWNVNSFVTAAPCGGDPAAPTSSAVTATGFTVNYTNNNAADLGYNLQYRARGSGWSTVSIPYSATNGPATFAVTGLNACTSYLFRIQAKCAAGVTNYIAAAAAVLRHPPLLVPRYPL